MLEFLVHKCIKDADEIERPEVRKRYGFFSSIVGIICNVILFASKLAIGLIAGSISIVSDGVNNLSDCATCIVTMFGYKMAAKPADRDHPFGHGRMEYLTSLVIAAAVVAVGFEFGGEGHASGACNVFISCSFGAGAFHAGEDWDGSYEPEAWHEAFFVHYACNL